MICAATRVRKFLNQVYHRLAVRHLVMPWPPRVHPTLISLSFSFLGRESSIVYEVHPWSWPSNALSVIPLVGAKKALRESTTVATTVSSEMRGGQDDEKFWAMSTVMVTYSSSPTRPANLDSPLRATPHTCRRGQRLDFETLSRINFYLPR